MAAMELPADMDVVQQLQLVLNKVKDQHDELLRLRSEVSSLRARSPSRSKRPPGSIVHRPSCTCICEQDPVNKTPTTTPKKEEIQKEKSSALAAPAAATSSSYQNPVYNILFGDGKSTHGLQPPSTASTRLTSSPVKSPKKASISEADALLMELSAETHHPTPKSARNLAAPHKSRTRSASPIDRKRQLERDIEVEKELEEQRRRARHAREEHEAERSSKRRRHRSPSRSRSPSPHRHRSSSRERSRSRSRSLEPEKWDIVKDNRPQRAPSEISSPVYDYHSFQDDSKLYSQVGEIEMAKAREMASEKKQEGNAAFDRRDYHSALASYSEAIRLVERVLDPSSLTRIRPYSEEPTPENGDGVPEILKELSTYYSNRATVYAKLHDYPSAHADAAKVCTIRPNWWKGWSIQAALFAHQQRFSDAAIAYGKCLVKCETDDERERIKPRLRAVQNKERRQNEKRSEKSKPIPIHNDAEKRAQLISSLEAADEKMMDVDVRPPSDTSVGVPAGQSPPSSYPRDGLPQPRSSRHVPSHSPIVIDDEPVRPPPSASPVPAHPPTPPAQPSSPTPVKKITTPTKTTDTSLYPYSQAFHFPIVTNEGIRDFVGDDIFAESLAAFEAKNVQKVRAQHGEHGGIIMGRCITTPTKKKQENAITLQYDVRIEFNDTRVSSWSCTCRGADADDTGSGSTHDDEHIHIPSFQSTSSSTSATTYKRPCKHIGAVLLVLKKKQHEETESFERASASDGSLASTAPSRRTMYVSPYRRQLPDEKAKEQTYRQQLSSLTVAALRSQLELNHQKKSGTKDQLISRCVDGMKYGALPHCPECGGTLFYAGGAYHCHGIFDRSRHQRVPCGYTSETVARTPWKT